jgi:hypothetical protein
VDLGEDLIDFELPATLRNWNFAKNAVVFGAVSTVLVWATVVSSWRLGWVDVALVGYAGLATALNAASWWLANLRVDFNGVRVGGLTTRRTIAWTEIVRFSIAPPGDRTPFSVAFWPWRDQARIVLTDRVSHRVRAIQPRHGFTFMTYFALTERSRADQIVEWLNRYPRTRATWEPT